LLVARRAIDDVVRAATPGAGREVARDPRPSTISGEDPRLGLTSSEAGSGGD
jgi:hypothetical protein